mmetsp:Transcript_1595/g.2468  ORF Transcript_1595/g.2468 Transcript_1595/m.2468 type:complete len:81 (+) Transcript_1595:121-363(+)
MMIAQKDRTVVLDVNLKWQHLKTMIQNAKYAWTIQQIASSSGVDILCVIPVASGSSLTIHFAIYAGSQSKISLRLTDPNG